MSAAHTPGYEVLRDGSATITSDALRTYRGKFVGVTKGMSGYFAVIYWWNQDMGGFWEPWDTGFGRHPTEDDARGEAIAIADMEGIPYLLPGAPVGDVAPTGFST